jgi:hypothetical protein
MSEHVTPKQHLLVEMNGRDQAVSVATDIEHIKVCNAINGIKGPFHIRKMAEIVLFDNPAPCLQGCVGGGVFIGENY